MTLTNEYQFIGRSNALTSASGYNYYILVYAKTAPDLTAGAHAVSVKMRLVCSADVYFYDWATSGYAKVGDVTAFEWSVQQNPSREWDRYLTEGGVTYPRWIDLKEGTALIGVGFGAAANVALETSWAHVYGTDLGWMPPSGKYATLNTTVTLPAIEGPTVPVVAASSVELGKSLTIQTTALLDGCTHTLSYSIGNATGVIAENVDTSCTWEPPVSLANQIPNSPSGTAVITCVTYRDGKPFGAPQQTTVLLIVPDTVVPTASATWEDASGALGALGVYVKGVSRLTVDVAGTGAYGSTITGASMTLGGKAYTGGVITSTGALALVVTVKDSRGRTGSKSYTINVVDYAAPTLTLTASRWSTANASGTADDMGEYAKITVTGYVAPAGSNTAALNIAYGSSSKAVSLTTGNVNYSMIVSAPSAATLPIAATLSDKLFSSAASMTLSIGYATVDFLEGGRGIAFGTTATKEGFTCHMNTDFGGYAVTGLPAPVADDAAATKGYVDTGLAKCLPLTGGTLLGPLILTEGVHYGDTLPEAGTPGRIFFKKVGS